MNLVLTKTPQEWTWKDEAGKIVRVVKIVRYKVDPLYGPNGKRIRRKNRTTGLNMCGGCFAFNCDPMTMSEKFKKKIDKRIANKTCPSCGHRPCKCKFNENKKRFS